MGIGGWCRGRVIGRGSSATVSIATATSTGEVFAVKSVEFSRYAVLQREHRILSSLRSPYVVSCFGFDVSSHTPTSGLCYNLFMEYAPRGSLSDEIAKRRGRLDEAAIKSYTYEILRGLAYLHSEGVVHCDVKGQNVLVGSDGRAKIADLGCARLITHTDDDDVEGECRRLRGTPMFMAPEVARGEEQGPPADLWALGCTVIEMASGRPPWPDVSDPVGAIHRVAFSPDVPDFPSWLPVEGKDFLSKCLRRDPRERWTAEQLIEHEFVTSSSMNSPSKPDADHCWVSPKSTLDQAFWQSLPDQDEEEDFEHLRYDPSARIQQLVSSCSPNWTWEENWMTVRGNREECDAVPSRPADNISDVETAASWDRISINESLDNSMVSSNQDTVDFWYNSYEFSVIDRCSNGDCYGTSVREEQQFVSCKTEVDSSNGRHVSLNYGQNIQFEISYWLRSSNLLGSFYHLSSLLVDVVIIRGDDILSNNRRSVNNDEIYINTSSMQTQQPFGNAVN